VIVVGHGRGQAFDVCIAKEKCKTHWSKEINARKRAATQREKGGASSKPARKPSWQIEEERRKAKAERWEKLIPVVMEAFCSAVVDASTAATGPLAGIIMERLYIRHGEKTADEMMPLGTTAEDLVRHVAFQILSDQIHDQWNAERELPKIAKAFGIDLKKVISANEKPAPAKKRKAS